MNQVTRDLFNAINKGNILKTLTLLDSPQLDVTATNRKGETALHLAVTKFYPFVINQFIEHNYAVNAQDKIGRTPLMAYQAYIQLHPNKKSTIPFLIFDKNPQFDLKDKNGRTSLHYEAIRETTPLIWQHLLQQPTVKLDEPDNQGITPYLYACASMNWGLIWNLQEKGANKNNRTNDGKTALHMLALTRTTYQRSTSLFNLIADENTLDVNAQDSHGETALHYAARLGHLNHMMNLIKMNANPCIQNKAGQTPYDVAKSKKIAMALKKMGKRHAKMISKKQAPVKKYLALGHSREE